MFAQLRLTTQSTKQIPEKSHFTTENKNQRHLFPHGKWSRVTCTIWMARRCMPSTCANHTYGSEFSMLNCTFNNNISFDTFWTRSKRKESNETKMLPPSHSNHFHRCKWYSSTLSVQHAAANTWK